MAMSSWMSFAYSPLPANHRESQVRLMPSRSPTGLTFFANHDREVREGLQDARAAAPGTGVETLEDQRLADEGLLHDEVVHVEVVVVLGVRDGAFEALADLRGDPLARELEIGERSRDLLAADHLRDQVELLRGNAEHPGDGLGLVVRKRAGGSDLAHLSASSPSCRPHGR
jgi:hypothetical protein